MAYYTTQTGKSTRTNLVEPSVHLVFKKTPINQSNHLLRLLLLGAVLDDTLAARDVDAELLLLPPLTALTCLFC